MGLLTGKYSSDFNTSFEDSLVNNKKSPLEINDLAKYSINIEPLLKEMKEIADKREKSIAQIALNYIICKGAIPIPGSRTIAQLNDNMGAMGWRLSASEIQKLEKLADRVKGFEGAGFKLTSGKFVGYGIERWILN